MSFFPTADPEKLRAAMAQDHGFYHVVAVHSPLPHINEDEYDCKQAWSVVETTSHDAYPTTQAMAWPSGQPQGLGLETLPTPTQTTFDPNYSGPSSYDVSTSWAPNSVAITSSTLFAAYTTQEATADSCYTFAAPQETVAHWDMVERNTSPGFTPSYDSPPSRSEYSTSSAQSMLGSSPYAHSDGCYPSGSTPLIKVESLPGCQRPRLYSVPDLMPHGQPLHVNPGDVYSSPPLTATERHTMDTLPPPAKLDEPDVKPSLFPPYTNTRRAVSEDHTSATELRRKRSFTTSARATCHCKICGKLFQRSYNLKAHMETHDPHRDQPHTCPYNGCRRRFVRRTDLVRHEQSVHLKERKHQCHLCYHAFARKDTLRRHIDDGCLRRPGVRKRLERMPFTMDFSSSQRRDSSQQYEQYHLPKPEPFS